MQALIMQDVSASIMSMCLSCIIFQGQRQAELITPTSLWTMSSEAVMIMLENILFLSSVTIQEVRSLRLDASSESILQHLSDGRYPKKDS